MEEKIKEQLEELVNKGLTYLEAYDVLVRDLQLLIDKARQDRKKVLSNTINNLDQTSFLEEKN